jgi:hypothetical protein
MPITQKDDQQALDWLVNNPSDSRSSAVMNKLGVGPDEVQAWKWSKSNLADPRVIEVRNKVFDTIASSRPSVDEMPSGAIMDRMVIKNLLDAEPDLQAEYLKKKGYDVRWVYKEEKLKPARLGAGKAGGFGAEVDQQPRSVKEQVLELKRPGDNKWGVIDPKSVLDLWDVTDVIGDAVEAAAGAVASGSKPFGPVGIIGGGLATAGVEAGKQGIAKAIGAREELNPSKITQAGITGMAIPGIVGLTGKAVKLGGALYNKGLGLLGIAPKAEAGAIEESAKLLGAKATPGQLYASPLIQKQESALYQSTGKLGGMGTRSQIAANQKAIQKASEELVKDAAASTAFEVGQKAEKELTESVASKLAPAEEIYNKYESIFSRNAYKPDMSSVDKKILELEDEFKLDKKALSLIKEIKDEIPKLDNLTDVKKFRTLVSDKYDPNDKATKRIVASLYGPITDVRSNTLVNLAKNKGDDFFNVAKSEIEQADAIIFSQIN